MLELAGLAWSLADAAMLDVMAHRPSGDAGAFDAGRFTAYRLLARVAENDGETLYPVPAVWPLGGNVHPMAVGS